MTHLTSRSRSLFVLLCLALCACEYVGAHQVRSNNLAERQQLSILPSVPTDSATTATTTTGNTNTDTKAQTTSTQQTTTQQTTQQTTTQETTTNQNTGTTTTAATTQQQQTTQTSSSTNTNTQQPTNTQPTQNQPSPTDTVVSTTDSNGSPVVVTTVFTPTASAADSSSATASASQSADSDDSGGSGIGTGSIIGIAVAGGVAVLGVIAFFIWKFTRKRYTDFDDEPIKWPELNSHANDNVNYALPTDRSKTGAGVGLDSASEVNVGRNASVAAYSAYSQPSQYTHPSAADSAADLYAPGGDPYAVPPLPHLNPNQPYHDEPGYGAGYYDPYRGPVPQTFNDGASITSGGQHGGEAIPMNNLGAAQAGRRSPAPQMGLDPGRAVSPQPPMAGRQSPGPSLAYGGRTTPAVGPVASGRHSPGPGAAYGGNY